jgi:hypothetical protein
MTVDDLISYINTVSAGRKESFTGIDLNIVMTEVMFAEAKSLRERPEDGGNRNLAIQRGLCSIGTSGEIGIFQYLASTWGSSPGNLKNNDSGRPSPGPCWKIQGQDNPSYINLYTNVRGEPLGSDGGVWNPFAQIRVTSTYMNNRGACHWTTFDGLYDTQERWCPYSWI